jgi:hypothetical protein
MSDRDAWDVNLTRSWSDEYDPTVAEAGWTDPETIKADAIRADAMSARRSEARNCWRRSSLRRVSRTPDSRAAAAVSPVIVRRFSAAYSVIA